MSDDDARDAFNDVFRMVHPERAILADYEALERSKQAADAAQNPFAKAAHQVDVFHLQRQIKRYEVVFFLAHGIS